MNPEFEKAFGFLQGVKSSEVLRDVLANLLNLMDPELRDAMLIAAVTRWFTEETISSMSTSIRDVHTTVRNLKQKSFVRKHPDEGYTFHELIWQTLRNLLIRGEIQSKTSFTYLNNQALDYFRFKLGELPENTARFAMLDINPSTSSWKRDLYAREKLFHLFYVNEIEALKYFKELFELSERSMRLGTCQLIVSIAEEPSGIVSNTTRLWINYYKIRLLIISQSWELAVSQLNELLLVVDRLPQAEKRESIELRCQAYDDLGMIKYYQGEAVEGAKWLTKSRKIRESLGNKALLAQTLRMLGKCYRQWTTKWDESEGVLKESIRLYTEAGDPYNAAQTSVDLAYLLIVKSEFRKSVKIADDARRDLNKLGFSYAEASAMIFLGWALLFEGNWKRALSVLERSKERLTRIGIPIGEGKASLYLGNTYTRLRRWDVAEKNYLRAKEIFESLGAKSYLSVLLGEIGRLYVFTGRLDEAGTLINKSITLKKEIADEFGIAWSLYDQSNRLRKMGKTADSLKAARTGLRIMKNHNSAYGYVLLATAVMRGLLFAKKYIEANIMAAESINMCKSLKINDLLATCYSLAGKAELELGNQDEAKNQYRLSVQAAFQYNSIFGIHNLEDIMSELDRNANEIISQDWVDSVLIPKLDTNTRHSIKAIFKNG